MKNDYALIRSLVLKNFTKFENLSINFSPKINVINANSQFVALHNPNHRVEVGDKPVFIPTKEVLSFMKGFTSLYEKYGLSFDQTYYDICVSLDLPEMRSENISEKSKWAIEEIEKVCGGRFIFNGGGNVTFKSGDIEYSANYFPEWQISRISAQPTSVTSLGATP